MGLFNLNGKLQPQKTATANPALEKSEKAEKKEASSQSNTSTTNTAPPDITIEDGRIKLSDKLIFHQVIQTGSEDKDLVRFAQYLFFNGYVKVLPEEQQSVPDKILFDFKVNYCSMKNNPSSLSDLNVSRLGQSYFANLFNDAYGCKTFDRNDPIRDMKSSCKYCKLCDKKHAFCPYIFCAIAIYYAPKMGIGPYKIFTAILEDDYQTFYIQKDIEITDNTLLTALNGVDSKSAHAAFLFLRSKCFTAVSCADQTVEYQYIPLCRHDEKDSLIRRMTNFWRTESDVYGRINFYNKDVVLNQKQECLRCEFKQCPDRLAAYFTFLGSQFCLNPIDLAYYAARHNTTSQLSLQQQYVYGLHLDKINDTSFYPESKELYFKTLKYIVNRYNNNAVPFMPFNFVVHTSDEELADLFYFEFYDSLWYFDYFKNHKNCPKKIISVAKSSFEEILSEYQNASDGTIFHLKQIELLRKDPDFDTKMQRFSKILDDKKNIITVISGSDSTLKTFFDGYPDLYQNKLSYHMYASDMDSSKAFDGLCEKLENSFELTDTVKLELQEFVSFDYMLHDLKNNAYIEWLYNKLIFNHFNNEIGVSNEILSSDIPLKKTKRNEKDIFKDLNELIGLSSVKELVAEVNDYVGFYMKIKHVDTEAERPNLHMVFSGNAGTGKTTVAKLMAEILYNIGFIKQNKLVVCSGKDLIGQYLGSHSI